MPRRPLNLVSLRPQQRVIAQATPRKGGSTTLIELRPQPLSAWDITAVRVALDQHEDGDLSRSALLAEAMMRDPRIGAGLRTRINALVGKASGFCIEAADESRWSARKLAERVESWWWDAIPDGVLARITFDVVTMGVAYGTISWSTVNGEWLPTLTPWHPGNLTWEDSESCWYAQSRSGRVKVTAEDPAWFLVEPGGKRSFMGGAVRALGLPFVLRSFSERDWVRYNERHGMPVIKVREPLGLENTERDAFYSRIKRMGREAVVGLPGGSAESGGDVEFLEFKSTGGQDAFGSFLARLDKQIDLTLLGQTLTTEVEGGSLAAARVHDRVRGDYLAADAEALGTELRRQVIVPWCTFNVPAFKAEDAPWPKWETEQPENLNESVERIGKALTALQTAQDIGLPVDVLKFSERFDIPLMEDVEDEASLQALKRAAMIAPELDALAKPPAEQPQARAGAGFVEGQLYADALAERASAQLAKRLSGDIDEIMKVVNAAESYDDVRSKLVALYSERMSPEAISVLVERVLVLSQLAGVSAVMQDT